MDGPRGRYAKWDKSDRETSTARSHLHVESEEAKLLESEKSGGDQEGGGTGVQTYS